jgi:N-acetylglucosamine kinase-like BadF-type ATPase
MTPAHSLIIGIDAGASKTHCRLRLAGGKLISESTHRGANLANQPISECVQLVIESIKMAVKKVNDPYTFASPFKEIIVVVGIAGLNTGADKLKLLKYLREFDHPDRSFLGTKSLWFNDAIIGFAANSIKNQGLVVIAGTGSAAAYLSPKNIIKSGNWGYVLGDDFSGFALGQRLLKNLMATLDGRKKPTVFYRRLAALVKVSNPYQLVTWLEKGNVPISRTASIIQLIEKNGLSKRREFVLQASHTAIACAQAVNAIVANSPLTKADSPDIVLSGGLFNVSSIALPIRNHLQNALPKATLIFGPNPPVEGAITLGIESLATTPRFYHHAVEI